MSARLEEAFETIEDEAAPRFILVCLLLLLLVGLLMLLPESTAGRAVMTIFTGLVLMAAVWASHVRSRLVHILNVVVVLSVIFATLTLILRDENATTAFAVVMTAFTVGMPLAIGVGLRDERSVNIQTVFGAISLYFMIGLMFTFMITLTEVFLSQPYFAQGTDGSLSQRVYFSFVTLATLGYGDLTPQTDIGRLLAVFETVIGSLYLVTAVSLVVARLGHQRTPRGAAESAVPGSAEPPPG